MNIVVSNKGIFSAEPGFPLHNTGSFRSPDQKNNGAAFDSWLSQYSKTSTELVDSICEKGVRVAAIDIEKKPWSIIPQRIAMNGAT